MNGALPGRPPVFERTLPNGLRLLVLEKTFVPTVSFALTFRAGNADCPPGKTGLAHMFEHMAFKGTRRVNTRDYAAEKPLLDKADEAALALRGEEDKGAAADPARLAALRAALEKAEEDAAAFSAGAEFTGTLERLGAHGLNAYTSADETVYHLSIPSDRAEAWFALEADRFLEPVLREFYRERSVVMEERRMGETSPGSVLYERLCAAAFRSHPYGAPVVGWMDDIRRYLRADAEAFHAAYYVPNNATLAAVGDIRPAEAARLAEKYFSAWKPAPLPAPGPAPEPEQEGERRETVPFDAEPAFYLGFRNPPPGHPDEAALIMVGEVLAGGKTCRFYRGLVEGRRLALGADSHHSLPGSRYPSLFLIAGTPRAPHGCAELEAAVWEELDRLKREPPSDWELGKVLNACEADIIRGMEGNSELARTLSRCDRLKGNWAYNWELLEALRRVRPSDVSAAAGKYLRRERCTAVTLARPAGQEASA